MEFFYDGQIRRYITQTIRALSNFVVKYGDGTLVRIPVMYGDADRQVASIIRNNSENKVNSVPRISVYITGLAMDRDRLSDQTFVGTVNIRERDIDPDTNRYTTGQGRNYTIERLMPTPFKLTMKCDIWSANTDQKLQILEQILVLFNPSLELQTTDNYVDWTSLTVLNLGDINWDSRTVPVGTDTPIDIATLTLDTPIWINPPVKVKHLGVITKIVTSMYNTSTTSGTYIDGLGQDPIGDTTSMADLLGLVIVSDKNYRLEVHNEQAILIGAHESVVERGSSLEMPVRLGTPINWNELFARTPNKYKAGSSQLYLTQPNGSLIVGTFAINSLDETILQVKWNVDTLTTNTGIDSAGLLDSNSGYNLQACYRPNSPGTFDAIIDPQQYDPKKPNKEAADQPVAVGRRFLIIEDIGYDYPGEYSSNVYNSAFVYQADDVVLYQNHYYKSISLSQLTNVTPTDATKWFRLDGATAWRSNSGVDFIAKANDIIEWTGTQWTVIFKASQNSVTMVWQTNIYTGIQYLWNGVSWVRSFEGVYEAANWKIVL